MNYERDGQLAEYLNALSFTTIARVPDPPLTFGIPSEDLRQKHVVEVGEFNRKKNLYRFKGQITDWTLWTIADKATTAQPDIHLTGRLKNSQGLDPFLTTSQVLEIASDLSGVVTKSGSLYEISNERAELTNDAFVHLICVLNSWGLGAELGLPPLHY